MSFHPRMYASVRGFDLLEDVRNVSLGRMSIDGWSVRNLAGASGTYVSMHPRCVILLDGATIGLATARDAAPVVCAACMVPAGLQLWGRVARAGRFRHLDIHMDRATLAGMLTPGARADRPVFLATSEPLWPEAEAILAECARRGPDRSRLDGLIRALVTRLLEGEAHPAARPTVPDWLDRVERHVHANLDQSVGVGDLVAISGLSRTHFDRLFRAHRGLSAHAWVQRARIAKAQDLMRARMPLAEVASATGFADQPHFTKAFRKMLGTTPGRYRRDISASGAGGGAIFAT